MKLWQKGKTAHKKVDQFTVGKDREYDLVLAQYDCQASIAHAKMLAKIGVINSQEGEKLTKALKKIQKQASDDNFTIEDKFEDIHSKIEDLLIKDLGDLGKKIHTARSRNDQVLVAMHLYLKHELTEIKKLVRKLFELLLSLAKEHQNNLMPGYTHMQIAMPSSFGLWFSAYAESLIDDLYFWQSAYKIADQNPLGSAAGFGSAFPIDRKFTTESLGFTELKVNSVAAQMARGKLEKSTATALSAIGSTMAKLCMDICLYMGQDFNFLYFPDELTTGSSIMPHKKNPDLFELVRGKCNMIVALPNQIALLTANLPSGYHRDLQLTKRSLVSSFDISLKSLSILPKLIKSIKVNKKNSLEYIDNEMKMTDKVYALVKQGIPFRDAYNKVKNSNDISQFSETNIANYSEGSPGNLKLNVLEKRLSKQR